MLLKTFILCVAVVTIFLFHPICGTRTCKTKRCGPNEVCTECKPNECNTYSCENLDGEGKICSTLCNLIRPKCICDKGHHRATPGAPCTRLKCPKLPTLKCASLRCGRNEECVECEPNECNTYTCANPDGKGKVCTAICKNPGPRCICKPNHHKVRGECVRLQCDNKPPCYY